jgi:orotidine-5'-phosphate decarboxylase
LGFDFTRGLAPWERLVFPLDFPDAREALKYVRLLAGAVGFFKVGLELFTAAGPGFVGRLRDLAPQAGLFLDLKFHDIPATVARAVKSVSRLTPDLLTVHAQGGEAMMRAAVDNAGSAKVLAVTLLTSLLPDNMDELGPGLKEPGAYALLLAKRALSASCQGLVSSSLELPTLRGALGDGPLIIVPGIRPEWAAVANDDQARVGTPGAAIASGATLLVVGRPSRDAADPLEAARRTASEIS